VAARRLIIVLVLLLASSVVAAALAPDRSSRLSGDESTTTTTTATEDSAPTGVAVSERIVASAEEPPTVEVSVGDQLALSVGSDPARTIVIEELGLAEFAEPEAPAHFDLLLRDPGAIPLTDADSDEIVGCLLVAKPGAAAPECTEPGGGGEGAAEEKDPRPEDSGKLVVY